MAESAMDLQSALNNMALYCKSWKLSVNHLKTKVVIFSKGKLRNKPIFTYDGNVIDIVDDFLYLGVKFNFNGKFSKEESYAAQQANKSLFSLLSKSRALNLELDLQVDLFDKVVSPVLMYGSEVWGPQGCNIVSRVQLKYYKYILKLKKSTCSNMVLGEVGKLPIAELIKMRVLNYWFKIVTCENVSKINVMLYNVLWKLHVLHSGDESYYESPWILYVKNNLNDLGLSYLWNNQGNLQTVNNLWFQKAIKLRIEDQYKSKWRSELLESNSCTAYRIFKTDFASERYLKVLPVNLAIKMAKFRCRNNGFPATKKLYDNSVEAKCTLCNANSFCDEVHLLLECEFFSEERLEYTGRSFRNINIHLINGVMNSKSRNKLYNYSRFMNIIMSVFRH